MFRNSCSKNITHKICIISEWLANFDDFSFKVHVWSIGIHPNSSSFHKAKKPKNPRGVVAFLGPGFLRSKTIVLSTLKEILSFIKGENVSTIQVGGFFVPKKNTEKRCSQTKIKQKQKKRNEGGKEETIAAKILKIISQESKKSQGESCVREIHGIRPRLMPGARGPTSLPGNSELLKTQKSVGKIDVAVQV